MNNNMNNNMNDNMNDDMINYYINNDNETNSDLYQPLKMLSMVCSYKLSTFKYCYNCKITETPAWRRGPTGIRTLCNKCGIKYARKMLDKM